MLKLRMIKYLKNINIFVKKKSMPKGIPSKELNRSGNGQLKRRLGMLSNEAIAFSASQNKSPSKNK